MLEAHNPPWYKDFLERYRMEKDHDMYAWRATFDQVGRELEDAPSDFTRVADAARQAGGVLIRGVQLGNWESEVSTFRELFNATIGQNYRTALRSAPRSFAHSRSR